MTGWISLDRSIRKHWLFTEKRTFSKFEAWIYLLMEANHSQGKVPIGNQIVTVERGQNLTSKLKLSENFNWSRKKLDAYLQVLEREQMIHIKSTSKYTLITIANYDFYQSEEGRSAHQKNIKRTSNAHQSHNERTSNAHQTHTNNNDNKKKNDNNEKNEKKKVTAFDFFQNNGFGFITQYTIDDLNYYLDSFENDSDEIVTAALKIAKDRNKATWGYAKGILNNWLNTNLQSIDQVRAYEVQQKEMRNQKSYKPNALKSKEMTPKWLENPKTNDEPDTKSDDSLEKDRELFLKQLKAKETNNTD